MVRTYGSNIAVINTGNKAWLWCTTIRMINETKSKHQYRYQGDDHLSAGPCYVQLGNNSGILRRRPLHAEAFLLRNSTIHMLNPVSDIIALRYDALHCPNPIALPRASLSERSRSCGAAESRSVDFAFLVYTMNTHPQAGMRIFS
jgi:hypothetical protein